MEKEIENDRAEEIEEENGRRKKERSIGRRYIRRKNRKRKRY